MGLAHGVWALETALELGAASLDKVSIKALHYEMLPCAR